MTAETAINGQRAGHRGEFRAQLDLVHAGPTTVYLHYELSGSAGAPLIVVAGGISAGRHTIANAIDGADGWWQAQAASFGHHPILSIEWLGSDGDLDCPIEASDQAKAILATLAELQVSAPVGFIGASYGGMVGMHCAALAPDRISGLLTISAAHRSHPFTSAQRALQRQAIELGEKLGSPEVGVALARKLAILTYRTPQEFAKRFGEATSIDEGRARAHCETYLDHMGRRHSARMTASAYRRLSESIDLHRIEPPSIEVPSIFVAVAEDQLVPAADIEVLARAVPNGRFVKIHSIYGHDAFLKEEQAIGAIIVDFLKSLEPMQ